MYEKANIERPGLLHQSPKNFLQILMPKNYVKKFQKKWFTLGFAPSWL